MDYSYKMCVRFVAAVLYIVLCNLNMIADDRIHFGFHFCGTSGVDKKQHIIDNS